MSFEFSFEMGIRGFHFYQKHWTPSETDKIYFVQETNNQYDPCAVAVMGKFKTNLGPVCVGHVPIEISRFVFYSLARGCSFSVAIKDTKAYKSPLTQGGLEVRCLVTASWTNEEYLSFLKSSIEKRYSALDNEKDDSSDILRSINIPEKESDSESDDEAEGDINMVDLSVSSN